MLLHELLGGLIAQSDGSGMSSLLFPAAIVAIMYFLLLRPQQKAAKEQQTLIASLKKGDDVVTSSGIMGKIYAVADKVVTLEVANGVRLRVVKTFIQSRQPEVSLDNEISAARAEKDAAADKKEGK
jgi:preprotein translocase subunit YajC